MCVYEYRATRTVLTEVLELRWLVTATKMPVYSAGNLIRREASGGCRSQRRDAGPLQEPAPASLLTGLAPGPGDARARPAFVVAQAANRAQVEILVGIRVTEGEWRCHGCCAGGGVG